jgi:hypothetical protein
MNKRGSAGYVVAIIALVAIIMVGLIMDFSSKGCSNNKDCQENSYCGSDNECHQYPDKIIVKQSDNFPAALTLAVGIILAALILKKKQKI